jgi:hypothetical protein
MIHDTQYMNQRQLSDETVTQKINGGTYFQKLDQSIVQFPIIDFHVLIWKFGKFCVNNQWWMAMSLYSSKKNLISENSKEKTKLPRLNQILECLSPLLDWVKDQSMSIVLHNPLFIV